MVPSIGGWPCCQTHGVDLRLPTMACKHQGGCAVSVMVIHVVAQDEDGQPRADIKLQRVHPTNHLPAHHQQWPYCALPLASPPTQRLTRAIINDHTRSTLRSARMPNQTKYRAQQGHAPQAARKPPSGCDHGQNMLGEQYAVSRSCFSAPAAHHSRDAQACVVRAVDPARGAYVPDCLGVRPIPLVQMTPRRAKAPNPSSHPGN